MKVYIIGFCAMIFTFSLHAQIVSGPMLGNNTMREVHIWLQLDREAEVQLKYYPKDSSDDINYSTIEKTSFDNAFTSTLIAHSLEPGTTYFYDILINDEPLHFDEEPNILSEELDIKRNMPLSFTTQKLWQYRTSPPDFKFLLGSCLFTNDSQYDRPGRPYGQAADTLFSSMTNKKSDFMLWLGDNIYLRTPDFDSRTGIYYRYTDYKSKPYTQEFWSSRHHYAIWDDHDFGPNNSDKSYLFKDLTRQAFMDFWANPTYGRENKGVYSAFRWSDCYFILLDNRYYRDPNGLPGEDVTILGKSQLNWFKNQLLTNNRASFIFVVIGGQFLNPSKLYENYANYEKERNEIISFIQENKIQNVIFLSGDRHRTELSKLSKKDAPSIFDFTCSPLSSRTYAERSPENNTLRLPGTQVSEQNFGRISVSGETNDRQLKIEVFTSGGKEKWSRTISAVKN